MTDNKEAIIAELDKEFDQLFEKVPEAQRAAILEQLLAMKILEKSDEQKE